MNDYIEINTDNISAPQVGDNLFQNRATLAAMQEKDAPEVTILIQAYNRLEKTKRCVESVLKYTQGINYELILIDNGSTDDTLQYFRNVPYWRKRIVHITKNLKVGFPRGALCLNDFANYIVFLANDIIVTERWLDNLMICMHSDPKIGMVNPVSNNTSNLQCVVLPYSSYDEMQKVAAQFNQSDPKKWEDRLRLITLGTVYRKEVLYCLGWPLWDAGFFHDFADDDVTFSVRRAGYRAVLARDTWICHDHNLQGGEEKDFSDFQKSLEIGRDNFKNKYLGIDAWDDVNNYLIPYLSCFSAPHIRSMVKVLGVDTRCGMPILDVKNWLRRHNVFDTELSAFTQDAKYWIDLKTICAGPVVCDREEFLLDSFPAEYYDYVVMDRPFNRYHEPQKILNDAFSLCKKGGYVVCKLKNTASFLAYINTLGQREVYDTDFSYNIPLEVAYTVLQRFGQIETLIPITFDTNDDMQNSLNEMLPDETSAVERKELLFRMFCKEFLLVVRKK